MNLKVALAFSGGLDTSVVVRLLQEKYDSDVITVTVDVGQGLGSIRRAAEKSKKLGAIKHVQVDARKEFVEEYVFSSIRANGLYGEYPLSTALARYPMASKLVEIARDEKADAVAHGCTGRGNDQIRFDLTIMHKAPELKIIAPIRELNLDRKWEIEYAKKQGIPVPADVDKPYSIDENLWGRSIEGGILEDPSKAPPEQVYTLTKLGKSKPRKRSVRIGFEGGTPIALNGNRAGGIELISNLNRLAGAYGVGRIDMIEDRTLGPKSREIYEAPAAVTLIQVHKALEELVLTHDEIELKRLMERKWAELVYRGLWFDPLREDLDAFFGETQKRVTGEVKVRFERGVPIISERSSPFSLYRRELVSFEGREPDQRDAVGVLKLQGLRNKILRVRGDRLEREKPDNL